MYLGGWEIAQPPEDETCPSPKRMTIHILQNILPERLSFRKSGYLSLTVSFPGHFFFLTPGKAETAGLVGLCLCPHWRWGCAVGFHEKMSLLHVKCVPRGEVALKMLGDRVQGS